MRMYRMVVLSIAAVAVSACAGPDTASRNATLEIEDGARSVLSQPMMTKQAPSYDVVDVAVSVPKSLSVSEANSYYPKGDIVWREDPMGDRHAQVKTIVEAAAENAVASVDGKLPVRLDIQVTRFHALSQKSRYSFGGMHNVNLMVSFVDPATGVQVREPRLVVTNLEAFGGDEAIAAEMRGETQRVRLTSFLAHVLRTEMTDPNGYQDDKRGFLVALNKT